MKTGNTANESDQALDRAQILIVDDEAGVRDLLQTALSREGYDVRTAVDGKTAFACLPDLCPEVAIVDINLPGMDGLQICGRLSGEHGIEVILISGDNISHSYEDAAAVGACDFLLKPIRLRELALRVKRAIDTRKTRIERDETVQALHRLSITDELTGLYNSRHLFEQLRQELARAGRYGHALSLVILDLDHFKRVNDSHGHQKGDRVLQYVSASILRALRSPDTAYRYGGDEFTVILPETTAAAATVVAERMRLAAACDVIGDGNGMPVQVTASLGIAEWVPGEDGPSLVHRVDMAMFAAKHEGRNRVAVAGDSNLHASPGTMPARTNTGVEPPSIIRSPASTSTTQMERPPHASTDSR